MLLDSHPKVIQLIIIHDHNMDGIVSIIIQYTLLKLRTVLGSRLVLNLNRVYKQNNYIYLNYINLKKTIY